ncbi:MAG TPA: ABC transporter substrate-binding protein [Polyangiaceae bacterium]|jgi:ABC-type transport system substrate-binding protein
MRSIRRKTELVAVAALACGCQSAPTAPIAAAGNPAPVRGGILHLASFADIKSLDPAVLSDTLTGEVAELMFAGLVDFDDQGHVIPDLAERFEQSDDGTTYRFFLRDNIFFHDGSPVRAADCKRSIERALNPDTPNSSTQFYDHIAGFDAYTSGKTPHLDGVVVEGERVLAIHLREPDATFLPAFALQILRPVCPSAGDKYEDTWQPCGAGPFELASWDKGRGLRLVRFDKWWKPGEPYLDGVDYAYGMAPVTERFKLEQGDLDIDRELSLPDMFRYMNDPKWKPLGAYDGIPSIDGEAMNVEMPPFDNVEVRRAVAAAINRDHLRLLKEPSLVPLYRVLVPVLGGDDPNFPAQKYDYEAALEHMRRAGYPYDPKTGKGGWPKAIVYPVYKQGIYEYSAQIIQQDLAKIGIHIEIKTVSYPTYLMMTKRRGATTLMPAGWQQDFPDANDFFEPIFSTSAINDEDSNNASFYSNPKLDDLIKRGRREIDPAKRKTIYDEADAIVCSDAPWAMEYQYRYYGVHQPYVKGLRWSAVWPNYVRDVWLDKRPAMHARRATGIRALLGMFE